MSAEGNAVKSAVAAAKNEPQAPPPLIAPTGDASLDVLVGDINNAAAPFQSLSDPEASNLDKANAVIGGTLSAISMPMTLLDDGFALLTRDIANLLPAMPAATLGMLHLGTPHMHTHPPAMPIPLPSLGPVALAGCASVLINGIPAARAGDLGISLLCGSLAPPFEVSTGSSKVFIGGARAARALDFTIHCMPGAGAVKATSKLSKVVSIGTGVLGLAPQVLDAVTTAERAKKLRAKAGELEAIEPLVAAQTTAEEIEEAKAEAEAEKQAVLDEASAEEETAKMTGIQTGADAAALALSLLMGMDPGTPPCIGAVLTGHPNVLIGGFPMPPWSAVARGLGKLGRLTGKRQKPRSKGSEPPRHGENFKCDGRGEPIDPVTGAAVDEWLDYQEQGVVPFRWGRSYNSADAEREGPMGRGFHHSYELSLTVYLDLAIYTDAEGRPTEIPLPREDQEETTGRGYTLRIRGEGSEVIYAIERRGEPTVEFARARRAGAQPRLTRLVAQKAQTGFLYDAQGRMIGMLETSASGKIETRLVLDGRGRILEVRRRKHGERDLRLVAGYGYDVRGCLVISQDALGAKSSYAYDVAGRMVCKTDPNGYSFHYMYDDQGRCFESYGSDSRFCTRFRYNRDERRTYVTEVDGGEWMIEYDDNGTIVRILDPYGGERRRVLDDEGRVAREEGPGTHQLRFLYDRTGRHVGVADRFDFLHPTLDAQPNQDDALALRVPKTPWEQQWGSDLGQIRELPDRSPAPARKRDALGRVVEEVDAEGGRQVWRRDGAGNLVWREDRDGREYRTIFTSWNLVSAEIDPLGYCTNFDYTMRAKIARVVDPGGSESRYEYDLKDRLIRVSRHGVVREQYIYDVGDRLIEKRDGSGNVLLRRRIGSNGLPMERRLRSGEIYRYEYNVHGQVTRASMNGVEVRRDFDRRGRLICDERNGLGVRHRFEGEHLRETTYFGLFTVEYHTMKRDSLLVVAPVGGMQRIRRFERGEVVAELGNGTKAKSLYDENGRCRTRLLRQTRERNVASWCVRYDYSAEGDLRRVEDNVRGVTEYFYDAAHRLIGEKDPDGVLTPIRLDAAGNLLAKRGLERIDLLDGNRLLAAGAERFRYNDRNHIEERQAADGGTTRYKYDSNDMLVEVSCSGSKEAWTAGYDGLRRRVYKSLGKARTEYFWDEHRLAAELGPTGALRIYVYPGPNALVPLMFVDYESIAADPASGKVYYPIGNQIGVPLHIEDQMGNVAWMVICADPYGELVVASGSAIKYALRFPGHYLDVETGLHYNRFRYYDPRLGRYIQSDPVGQSGGINLYRYPADPLSGVDLLGLVDHRAQHNTGSGDGGEDSERPPNNSDVEDEDSGRLGVDEYDGHSSSGKNLPDIDNTMGGLFDRRNVNYGYAGLYGDVQKNTSERNVREAEHTVPKSAWKGSAWNRHANQMPAVSIPYQDHRGGVSGAGGGVSSTGRSTTARDWQKHVRTLMRNGQSYDAIRATVIDDMNSSTPRGRNAPGLIRILDEYAKIEDPHGRPMLTRDEVGELKNLVADIHYRGIEESRREGGSSQAASSSSRKRPAPEPDDASDSAADDGPDVDPHQGSSSQMASSSSRKRPAPEPDHAPDDATDDGSDIDPPSFDPSDPKGKKLWRW
ncbi:RHS repeat-associated core domain-containing protein [Sorangium sp. So ce429]